MLRMFKQIEFFQINYIDCITNEKNSIGIEKGQFRGDVEQAIKAIQAFANDKANKISMESFGHGYGSITINGKENDYSRTGIDILEMLRLCNIKLEEPQQPSVGPGLK